MNDTTPRARDASQDIDWLEITAACRFGHTVAVRPAQQEPTNVGWVLLSECAEVEGMDVPEADVSDFINDEGRCYEGDAVFNNFIEELYSSIVSFTVVIDDLLSEREWNKPLLKFTVTTQAGSATLHEWLSDHYSLNNDLNVSLERTDSHIKTNENLEQFHKIAGDELNDVLNAVEKAMGRDARIVDYVTERGH
jgi:hypothetical protein